MSLWSFAGILYGQPAVQEHCLQLQDNSDVDVCVLLAMVWYAQFGVRLEESGIAELLNKTQMWREKAVATIRELRKSLAARNEHIPSLAQTDVHAVYTKLKQLELLAERATLNAIATNFPPASQTLCSIDKRSDCVRQNVGCYLSRFDAVSAASKESITDLFVRSLNAMQGE